MYGSVPLSLLYPGWIDQGTSVSFKVLHVLEKHKTGRDLPGHSLCWFYGKLHRVAAQSSQGEAMGQIPGAAKHSCVCLSHVSNGSAVTEVSVQLTRTRISWCLVRHGTGISCYIPPFPLDNPFQTEDARK